MIQIPGFRTVLRGYEPTEVDRAIGDLCKARDQARAEAADSALTLNKSQAAIAQLEEQLAGYRARLAKLESAKEETPAFSDIGARIGRMLALAEDEATELRQRAQAEADRLTGEATAEVEQLTDNAERHSRDVISKADTEAARILEAAKRQADEIVDYADREAVARREEAEAVYEAHRARAAAAAAEFEQNLAERRDKANAEFEAQSSAHEQAISKLRERHDNLELEAEQLLSGAKEQAELTMKAAREEAIQHVASARATAVKIRRESERELEAAVARRDSINAQLANLRQMLATLDDTNSTLTDRLAELKNGDGEDAEPVDQSDEPENSEDSETVDVDVSAEDAEATDGESDAELTEVIEVDEESRKKVSSRGRQ